MILSMSKPVKLAILCAMLALLASTVQAFPGGTAGPPAGASPAATQAVPIKGTVVETMNAGGYTYVCIESGGQKQWSAMPTTEVKVGEVVEVKPSMVMHNFNSKALGRTFDSLIFSQGLVKQ
jgi:membrane protein implicated in regulation of membrane protease activity